MLPGHARVFLKADDVDKEFDFDTTTDEAVPLCQHA